MSRTTSLLALLAGCGPASLTLPALEVSPELLEFGDVVVGDEASADIVVRNAGDGPARLARAEVDGDSAFEVDGTLPDTLEPGGTALLSVRFQPHAFDHAGRLRVRGDDDLDVSLHGIGLLPRLHAEPVTISAPIDCERSAPLTIESTGRAAVEITAITPFLPAGAWLDPTPLPKTLLPGEQLEITAHAGSAFASAVEGDVVIASSDPAGPRHVAVGATFGERVLRHDRHVAAPREGAVDLIVAVDTSADMEGLRAELAGALPRVLGAFDASGVDARLMVVTDDDGCRSGFVLDARTPDLRRRVDEAMNPSGADWAEALLYLSRLAVEQLGAGQCNAGFRRGDARLVLLAVSNVPEQSHLGANAEWSTLRRIEADASFVGVGGSWPLGCLHAEPGSGYYQVATRSDTDGWWVDLCTGGWADLLSVGLPAFASRAAPRRYALSGEPVSAVEVTVGGVDTLRWTFEADPPAVVLDYPPPLGAEVEITYAVEPACD